MAGINSTDISPLQHYAEKITEDRGSGPRRPLGVKLRAEEIALLDDGREWRPVRRHRRRIGAARRREAVHEVGVGALRNTGEERGIANRGELVPAHLRYRQVGACRQT